MVGKYRKYASFSGCASPVSEAYRTCFRSQKDVGLLAVITLRETIETNQEGLMHATYVFRQDLGNLLQPLWNFVFYPDLKPKTSDTCNPCIGMFPCAATWHRQHLHLGTSTATTIKLRAHLWNNRLCKILWYGQTLVSWPSG